MVGGLVDDKLLDTIIIVLHLLIDIDFIITTTVCVALITHKHYSTENSLFEVASISKLIWNYCCHDHFTRMFPRSENQGIKRNNSTDTRKLVGISEGKFEFFGNFEQIDTLKDQKKFYYLSGVE